MKIIVRLVFFISVCLLSVQCKNDDKSFTTYSRPAWSIASPELYPYSFVAVVRLPDNLSIYAQDKDMVAAFLGDECRGVGSLIKSQDSTQREYYITIRGNDTENRNIKFMYYSSRLSYMYQAKTILPFEIDGTYGTYDEPVVLDLKNL